MQVLIIFVVVGSIPAVVYFLEQYGSQTKARTQEVMLKHQVFLYQLKTEMMQILGKQANIRKGYRDSISDEEKNILYKLWDESAQLRTIFVEIAKLERLADNRKHYFLRYVIENVLLEK